MAAVWLAIVVMTGTACTADNSSSLTDSAVTAGAVTTSDLTTPNMPSTNNSTTATAAAANIRSTSTNAPNPASTASSPVPPGDEQAIRVAMQQLNGTAAGRVADQRSVLAALVDPALVAVLDQCPTATTTLRFEPSYRDLRPSPEWQSPSGKLSGTVYALPSLVRIYTGDRITGTDLTTLHLGVQAGEAYLTPVCVG